MQWMETFLPRTALLTAILWLVNFVKGIMRKAIQSFAFNIWRWTYCRGKAALGAFGLPVAETSESDSNLDHVEVPHALRIEIYNGTTHFRRRKQQHSLCVPVRHIVQLGPSGIVTI
jgi:hypothetical protein